MTRHGGKIPEVTAADVRARLSDAEGAKAVKRLLVAREYIAGLSPAEIEAKYGVPEQTVYDWLDRFEERGLEGALSDDRPTGRRSRLSDRQRRQFERAVGRPPGEAGVDATSWTASAAREYLQEAFGVEFSRRHAGRLVAEARQP